MSPAKTAEPTEMPFSVVDSGGPKEPRSLLAGGPDPPMARDNFKWGKGRPIVKYKEYRLRAAAMRPYVKLR